MRVQDQASADAEDDAWRVQHEATASRSRAAQTLTEAQQVLTDAIAQATSTLGGSEGQVADDAVRQALAAAVAAAQVPATSVVAVRAQVAAVQTAESAVVDARTAWQAAQAAQAMQSGQSVAAAPSGSAASAASGTGASGGSCTTTYTGPPFYTSAPTDGGDGSNGRLPASMLAAISWDVDPHGTPYYLRTAAAAALERLDVAFVAAFGHHLDLDLTYRDYDTQVAMREALGTVAAVPGTSSHGTGLALDVPELPCEYGWDTAQRSWLVTNGPSYGWVSPSWARRGGSNPEYWHFEYVG
ncbi:hypothetical protein CSO01_25690 [Cellulomonas soli]|uniref:D-alanyl-D-alanine carboxypeptidase-like core domain-containing protein n=1 Tax=Cellulomonas soli TaxID=931535 RepID=A0A512PF72_9CELL|nr:hypothetical protein CSO01_25690 [Cellulomonas soli]